MESQPRIRVVVRKRPLSKKEVQQEDVDIVDVDSSTSLVVKELK